jgi:Zn-dependent M28 family amino/carboxypeptidase
LPLEHAAAVLNLDGVNLIGRTRDVVMIGRGASTLDEIVEEAARAQGRTVTGDPEPEKGFFYRSDHLPFLQAGVPAFYPHPGVEVRGRPAGWGLEQRRRYVREDYHQPSDVVREDWDLAGTIEDAELTLAVGRAIADAEARPEWKPGSEFRAAGERRLGRAPAGGGSVQ